MIKLKGTLGVRSLLRAAREVRELDDWKPIVVAGASVLVPLLAKELRDGGEPSAVREGGPVEDAAAFLYVLPGPQPDEQGLDLLRSADRAQVPIVCLAPVGVDDVPYVLAEDIVHAPPGEGFPLDELAEALARRLGDEGVALARRLPALRRAVCEELIRRYSRRNGLIGAAVFLPGLDLPILTLNQIRLVLRIAYVYGHEPDRERLAEVLPVIGSGFALRALARELLDFVPVGGWLLKGGVAYAGTRAIGEAAVRYFEAGGTRALAERVS